VKPKSETPFHDTWETCGKCGISKNDIEYWDNHQTMTDYSIWCKNRVVGYSTGKWSDDDDFGITPFFGPNR
jgi:hypothetical protein